jgi:hypothetical protein
MLRVLKRKENRCLSRYPAKTGSSGQKSSSIAAETIADKSTLLLKMAALVCASICAA